LFGFFNLVGGISIKFILIGIIDDIFAKLNQLTPKIQVINQFAVITGIDDRNKIIRQLCQIFCAANFSKFFILLEKGFERNRVGQLATFDLFAAGFKNSSVTGIGEMFWAQDVRNTFIGSVVIQNRAKKGCFRLEVVRSHTFKHHFGAITVVYIKRGKKGV